MLVYYQAAAIMLGIFVLLAYLFIIGLSSFQVLVRLFSFTANARTRLLGMFAVLMTLSSVAGAMVIFYKLSVFGITLTFIINACFWWAVAFAAARSNQSPERSSLEADAKPNVITSPLQGWAGLGVIIYLLVAGYAWLILYYSRTGAKVLTPWQAIIPWYIYLFAAATLILGSLTFSRLSRNVILVLLMLHSFLLTGYLPLTQNFIYGADGWRHMANENRLLFEEPFLEAQLSLPDSRQISKFEIGRLSYSSFWGLSVIIARLTNLGLIAINKWLQPVLWSIFFPLIMYKLGRRFGWRGQRPLSLVWLGFLPFALQAGGAFTLPVNFGFLVWLFLFSLLLKRSEHRSGTQAVVLASFGILLIFNYSLFFILFWLAWALAELVGYWQRPKQLSASILLIFGLGVMVLFVGIEWGAGYSFINWNRQWLNSFKQLLGNFSGWYLATGPRPHDIPTGNIIFNQTPAYALVGNWFTAWRWWLVAFMLAFWLTLAGGIKNLLGQKKLPGVIVLLLAAGLAGSYIIARYFLNGEAILTRRLDIVLAWLFIILFFSGWMSLVSRVSARAGKAFVIALSLVALSGASAASYSLGPDTSTVSRDEYRAMEYVWQGEKNNLTHCVLADTYPLLALEAISSKNIIGGGFPISATFAQPERERFFESLLADSSVDTWRDILDLVKLNMCWLVAPKSTLRYNYFVKAEADNLREFGSVVVWKYTGPSVSVKKLETRN